MSDVRINRPDRRQPALELVDLDHLVDAEHRVRAVWAFVAGLDLRALYERVRSCGSHAGRAATDPALLLGLWIYATSEGVGSARALARLCEYHAIYRWLCGGVGVNHTTLSAFRRDCAEVVDPLLSASLTALIGEGLLSLDEVITDGTKVRAAASKGSMRRAASLQAIAAAVAARIVALREELDRDPSVGERRRLERRRRIAEARAARVAAALATLAQRERERGEWSGKHPGEAARAPRAAPRASTTDAEARMMRMADDAMRCCYNVQVATACGFVVAVEPTTRGNDTGLAPMMVAAVERRCGMAPLRLLADNGAMTVGDITALARSHPALCVYAPPKRCKESVTPETLRRRARNLAREPLCLQGWRARMATPEGEAIYARRVLTEHVHAKLKNRGFGRLLVRGLARVRAVCLLHALTHNMLHAMTRRAQRAALAAA